MVASYTRLLTNRMQGLVQDLLAYSRAGVAGKVLHEISSEKALTEALTNLRATIHESSTVVMRCQ
jgi:light-regulated signal transduction histidine kinase (bacteriophytochrome)